MKTFSIASDIIHLIFSTSFYLDELNPVIAWDPEQLWTLSYPRWQKFYWPHAFYPRDAMLARVRGSDSNVSVRLSVTSRYCVEMKKASVMISSLSGSPTIIFFWCHISSQHSEGFPRARASNKVVVGKFRYFLALSINILKTVADTAKVTIND